MLTRKDSGTAAYCFFHSLSFLSFPMTSLGTIEGLITPFIKDSQVRSESLIAMRNLIVLHKGIQFN